MLMKLHDLLEYSSANPFVAIVSALELRLREVDVAVQGDSIIFKSSLERQLTDLKRFLESAKNWNVPEEGLRRDLHAVLPKLLKYVETAIGSPPESAKELLTSARRAAIKASHLKFGSFS